MHNALLFTMLRQASQARADLAMSRVLEPIAPELANEYALSAWHHAAGCGLLYGRFSDMPMLLAQETHLADGWDHGCAVAERPF